MGNPNPKTKFTKGSPIASLAGKKSSNALPPELKEARSMNANKVETILYKYMGCTADELNLTMKEKSTPAIELLVVSILMTAIQSGDHQKLNFLLERTIGKVIDKSQVDVRVGIQTLHDEIMNEIRLNDNKS